MKAWFLRFSLREQIYLLCMAAALGLYALFTLALGPLASARESAQNRNRATLQVLQRVDALTAELRERRRAAGDARAAGPNLTAQLNASADRFALPITRLQPNSRGAVQLRFEGASLEALLRWMHHLETAEGLLIEELSITQTSSAGVVSATLRVAAPG